MRRDINVGDLVSYRKNPDDKGIHVGLASSIVCDSSDNHALVIFMKVLTPVRGAGTQLKDSSWSSISGEMLPTSEENLVDGVHTEEEGWELCSTRFVRAAIRSPRSEFQLPDDAQSFVKAAVTAYSIRMELNGANENRHTIPVFKSRPMRATHAELRTVMRPGDRVIYQPWDKKNTSYSEVGLVTEIISEKGKVRYLKLNRYTPTHDLPGHYTLAWKRSSLVDFPTYSPSTVKVHPFFIVGILDEAKIFIDIQSDLE